MVFVAVYNSFHNTTVRKSSQEHNAATTTLHWEYGVFCIKQTFWKYGIIIAFGIGLIRRLHILSRGLG